MLRMHNVTSKLATQPERSAIPPFVGTGGGGQGRMTKNRWDKVLWGKKTLIFCRFSSDFGTKRRKILKSL